MRLTNFIGYILIAASELAVIDLIARNLLQGIRKERRLLYFLCAIYFFGSSVPVSFIYNPNLNTAIYYILSFMITFGYVLSIPKRILLVFIGSGIGIGVESFTWLLVRCMIDLSSTDITPNLWFFPLITVFDAVIKVIIAFIFCKLVTYGRRHITSVYATLTVLSAALLMLIGIFLVEFVSNTFLPFAFIILALIFLAMALCIGLFRDQLQIRQERLKLEFLEKQTQDQVAHYTALYDTHNEVHHLRHDLKNFIITAQSLLDLKEYEKLKQHLTEKQEVLQPQTLSDTGNPMLDAVLSAKQQEASDVDFQVFISPLHCEWIDPMDIAMLLAAALDNAIEGSAKNENPYIQIWIRQKGKILSLKLENPISIAPIEKSGRLLTSKPDAKHHGYGLLSMKRIADRWHGNLNWEMKDSLFVLRVFLQDAPAKPRC